MFKPDFIVLLRKFLEVHFAENPDSECCEGTASDIAFAMELSPETASVIGKWVEGLPGVIRFRHSGSRYLRFDRVHWSKSQSDPLPECPKNAPESVLKPVLGSVDGYVLGALRKELKHNPGKVLRVTPSLFRLIIAKWYGQTKISSYDIRLRFKDLVPSQNSNGVWFFQPGVDYRFKIEVDIPEPLIQQSENQKKIRDRSEFRCAFATVLNAFGGLDFYEDNQPQFKVLDDKIDLEKFYKYKNGTEKPV